MSISDNKKNNNNFNKSAFIKRIVAIALIIMLLSFFATYVTAQASAEIREQLDVVYRSINIFVDGKAVPPHEDSFIIVDNGRLMLPIRTISEALNVNVVWDEDTGQVHLTSPPVPEKKFSNISELTVLRNIGPFYMSHDQRVSVANRVFGSGLMVDNRDNNVAEFVVDLSQRFTGFETYMGVEDSTQNTSSNYIVSFYADDRLIDSPGLRINEENAVKPAEYARWLRYEGLHNANRLKVRVEFIPSEDGIGDYTDIIAVLANFQLFLK